jgi:diguanylate cyclase (GGDEF)-like protein/PAS domain S-box-containing protein
MHFQRESKPVFPEDAEAAPDSNSASLNQNQSAEDVASQRPFVERRRVQPVAAKWHEALEPVHRLLVRYEEINQSLVEEQEQFKSLVENAVIGMFRMTPGGEPLILNPAMAKIFGYDSAEQMVAEVPALGTGMFVDPGKWNELVRLLEGSGIKRGFELEAFTRHGDKKWVQFDVRANFDGTTLLDYEGTVEDISDRKKENEHIWQLAYFDRVTGLPNRALFEEKLAESLNSARWNNQSATLLLLELNRFKIINDTIGRVCGDRLLQETSERIRTTLGPEVTVARLEGAEFGIILQGAEMVDDIEQIARRLVAAATAGVYVHGAFAPPFLRDWNKPVSF